MALIPYRYRPSVVIRRRAVRYGLRGGSLVWKWIAVFIYGSKATKSFFGKQPDEIATMRLGPNQFLSIVTSLPLSRKQQRRTGITRATLRRQAVADIEAMQRGS
jgi:hypothetical protein